MPCELRVFLSLSHRFFVNFDRLTACKGRTDTWIDKYKHGQRWDGWSGRKHWENCCELVVFCCQKRACPSSSSWGILRRARVRPEILQHHGILKKWPYEFRISSVILHIFHGLAASAISVLSRNSRLLSMFKMPVPPGLYYHSFCDKWSILRLPPCCR